MSFLLHFFSSWPYCESKVLQDQQLVQQQLLRQGQQHFEFALGLRLRRVRSPEQR
jgi:hypothetical protein